jgi:hypothetical protein
VRRDTRSGTSGPDASAPAHRALERDELGDPAPWRGATSWFFAVEVDGSYHESRPPCGGEAGMPSFASLGIAPRPDPGLVMRDLDAAMALTRAALAA